MTRAVTPVDMKSSQSTRLSLGILLSAQLALGLLYAFATPIFEASDELWHYAVVREIAINRRLPVQDPTVAAPWAQEGSQPPLYYALGALLSSGVDTSDYPATVVYNPLAKVGVPLATDNKNIVAHPPGQGPAQGGTALAVLLVRAASLLLGVATAYFTYRLGVTLYPQSSAVGLLAAAMVAFNPMVLFINASVNNDNLLMLLSAAALWRMVVDVQSEEGGLRVGQTLLLGLLLGLASLTKVSGLLLLPIAALAVTYSAWRARSWRIWLLRGLILALVVAAIAGWWYARNLRLYGELTGIVRMAQVAGMRPPGFSLRDLPGEWRSFWYAFWGVFGAFNVLAPPWFYLLTGALSAAAAGGLVLRALRCWRERRLPRRWQSHSLLALFILLTFVGVVRWTLMTAASQGRLMFGAVAAIALYLALGLLAWFPPRVHRGAAVGAAGVLAAVALALPLIAIAPSYRPPAPVAALPESAAPLDVACAGGVALVGYELGQDTVQAGQPLDITLYWRAARPLAEDLQLSVNAFGFREENVAKLDTWPGGGLLPTSVWQPGEIYPDRYLIPTVAGVAAPTVLRVGITWSTDLLDPTNNQDLPCVVDGVPVEAVFLDAGALVGREASQEALELTALSTLQHGIRLVNAQVDVAGDQATVILSWSPTGPVPGDYTVFLHLFNADGVKVAQDDVPPKAGYWPTSRWRAGEVVTSTHTLALPADLPAGQYALGAGMYDPQTGQRLFAYRPDGSEWRDWMVVLPQPVSVSP